MAVTGTEVVIIGAGIAGLATALALHRLAACSSVSGDVNSYLPFASKTKHGEDHEVRCVTRKFILETLAKELPMGTIRFSSEVVSIERGFIWILMLNLANGSSLSTQRLIGCDGVNSVVAKWLGLKEPPLTRRSTIMGSARFEPTHGHGLPAKFQLFMGDGVKCSIVPSDDNAVSWSFTWSPSTQENREVLENTDPVKLKQFVISKLGNVPDEIKSVIQGSKEDEILCLPIRCCPPWEVVWGNISKDNVCVIGDALHPMTPDLGQGECLALEDGVILARYLAEALSLSHSSDRETYCFETYLRVKSALNKFSSMRKWRAVKLITTGQVLGFVHENKCSCMSFLREKWLSAFLAGFYLNVADIDPKPLAI